MLLGPSLPFPIIFFEPVGELFMVEVAFSKISDQLTHTRHYKLMLSMPLLGALMVLSGDLAVSVHIIMILLMYLFPLPQIVFFTLLFELAVLVDGLSQVPQHTPLRTRH